MSFFIAPADSAVDLVTERMVENPGFADRYEAISDLRDASRQGLAITPGEAARANGFFRVASVQGPLLDLAKLLDPAWLKEKQRFYAWLDKHPQHVAYDRRKDAKPNSLTMSDGKVVL